MKKKKKQFFIRKAVTNYLRLFSSPDNGVPSSKYTRRDFVIKQFIRMFEIIFFLLNRISLDVAHLRSIAMAK